MSAEPKGVSSPVNDAKVFGAILAIWLVPWFLITWAAKLAGGGPSDNPVQFINPTLIMDNYRADGNHFVFWHLTGAFAPVNAFAFWVLLVLVTLIIGGGIFFVAMLWRGG